MTTYFLPLVANYSLHFLFDGSVCFFFSIAFKNRHRIYFNIFQRQMWLNNSMTMKDQKLRSHTFLSFMFVMNKYWFFMEKQADIQKSEYRNVQIHRWDSKYMLKFVNLWDFTPHTFVTFSKKLVLKLFYSLNSEEKTQILLNLIYKHVFDKLWDWRLQAA